jgi:hypothetical protein
LAVFAVCVGGFIPCTDGSEDESTDAPEPASLVAKSEKEARLTAMREMAKRFLVRRAADEQRIELFRDEPVFRYSDQPRGFADATVWCWGSQGRPIVLAKIEMARLPNGTPYWNFCVASLANGNVDVELGKSFRLNTKKAGIEFHAMPAAPQPAEKPAGRQRQMKDLVGQFAATINVDVGRDTRQEMRLLPTPVHRYSDDAAGIRDGTIFALTTNGTNPDTLIIIELNGPAQTVPTWQYGVVRMTTGEVRIRLNGEEVWTWAQQPEKETWHYFKLPRKEETP